MCKHQKGGVEKNFPNTPESLRLAITISETMLPKFFTLLQSGFDVKGVTGASIRDFLCGQIGLAETYVDERIQTLFLDSKPVDDAAKARIQDGSRLALSAAMPGVAGALFRKGGRYRAMRRGISYQTQDGALGEETGWVTLKLFNLVLKELGSFFLSRGVRLEGKAIKKFFSPPPEGMLNHLLKVEINGRAVEAGELLKRAWSEPYVFVTVASS